MRAAVELILGPGFFYLPAWVAGSTRATPRLVTTRPNSLTQVGRTMSTTNDGLDASTDMRVVPLNRNALLLIVAAAVGPMLLFVLSTIPLTDILEDLMEFMV